MSDKEPLGNSAGKESPVSGPKPLKFTRLQDNVAEPLEDQLAKLYNDSKYNVRKRTFIEHGGILMCFVEYSEI